MRVSKKKPANTRNAGHLQVDKVEMMAKAARLRFWEGHSLAEIADLLGYKNVSSASRLLGEAWKNGVVRVVIDTSSAISAERDERLERSLMEAFGLDGAIVVHAPEPSSNSTLARDDELHLALANTAGDELRGRIRSNSHIGVGGGRAVYNAIKRIENRPPRRRGVTITPLTGHLWARDWAMDGRHLLRPMDSDDVAYCLALALEDQPETRFSQIRLPAFMQSQRTVFEASRQQCRFLPHGKWKSNEVPDSAVVGIGTLDPRSGHRVCDLVRDLPPDAENYLRLAARELRSILNQVQRQKWPYCPVGDLVNRLFLHLPLPHQLKSLSREHIRAYSRLREKINTLNQRCLSVEWSHLNQIRDVMLIGGGPHKINALWTVIAAPHSFVREICTDVTTARTLLKASVRWEDLIKEHRWLKSLSQRLFKT